MSENKNNTQNLEGKYSQPVTKNEDAAPLLKRKNSFEERHEFIDTESCSVLVKNVQRVPDTEKSLHDFFSFCGSIANISVVNDESDESICSAVVTFQERAGAKTAVLLTNTALHNRNIEVQMIPNVNPTQTNEPVGVNPQPNIQIPPHIAETYNTIVGIGGDIANTAANAARDIDAQIHFTETVGSVVQGIDEKARQIDKDYHVTEQASVISQNIIGKANEIDQTYQISEKVHQVSESIKGNISQIEQEYQVSQKATEAANEVLMGVEIGAKQVAEFLNTNETAKAGVEYISDVSSQLGSALSGLWNTYGFAPHQQQDPLHQQQTNVNTVPVSKVDPNTPEPKREVNI